MSETGTLFLGGPKDGQLFAMTEKTMRYETVNLARQARLDPMSFNDELKMTDMEISHFTYRRVRLADFDFYLPDEELRGAFSAIELVVKYLVRGYRRP